LTAPCLPAHRRRPVAAAALLVACAQPGALALAGALLFGSAAVRAQQAAAQTPARPASAASAAAAGGGATGSPATTGNSTDADDCSSNTPAVPRRAVPASPGANSAGMTIEADRVSGRNGESLSASGAVNLMRNGMSMQADSVDYSLVNHRAHAVGRVSLRRGEDVYSGPELDLDTETLQGYFVSPRFTISRSGGLGRAERATFLGDNRIEINHGRYSTCPAPEGETPAWEMTASFMRLDIDANDGYAEGAVLRFLDVPILALPVLSFPVTDARKSGWLPLMINLSSKAGFELGVPYYWNIAPQFDATLMPTYSARQGSGVDAELRYLFPTLKGESRLVDLPDDQASARSRWAARSRLSGSPATDWGLDLDVLRTSDPDYWRDGLRGADSLTPRLLGSSGRLTRTRSWQAWGGDIDQTLYVGVQRWQLQQASDTSAAIAPPFQRAPQIGAHWGADVGRAEIDLQTEFNRFTNSDGNQSGGQRLHALGSMGWRFGDGAHQLTPRLSFNAASYALDTPLADGRSHLQRSIPSVSLDSRWILERDAQWPRTGLRQTLEPRLFYLHTPWRDQSQLPNFDSAPLDFNATTMFENNSFSGVDRVADAHLVTAGLTSRLIDAGNGAELAQVGVAQRFLLSEQRITPDGLPLSRRASDVFLIGSTSALSSWGVESAVQYNPDTRRMVRSIGSLRYTPEPFHSLSATYRLQREVSEQIALGWQWPLYRSEGPRHGTAPSALAAASADASPAAQAVQAATQQAQARRYAGAGNCSGTLYGVGRLDYSLKDSRLSGAIVGLEYDAGCWIGRLVAERQSTGVNTSTTKLMLQLELIGLSRLGSNPLAVLKDNIPGYKLLRDSSPGTGGTGLPAAGESTVRP
jgi:LPS-assembly protein